MAVLTSARSSCRPKSASHHKTPFVLVGWHWDPVLTHFPTQIYFRYLPKIGYKIRSHLMNKMVPGLTGVRF